MNILLQIKKHSTAINESYLLKPCSIFIPTFIPMEQPTIFEDNFGLKTIRHRRLLLPLWARIYCWIAMISGVTIAISILFYINYILENYSVSLDLNPNQKIAFFIEYFYVFLLGLVIFIVPFLLWMGKKWAIRFNWIVSALFTLPIVLVPLFRNNSEISSTLPILLLLPIWIAQALIQKDWETTATPATRK